MARSENRFRSLDQLRSMDWPSREKAEAALKASAFKPEGDDYALAEISSGHWQIVDRTEDVSQVPPEPRTRKAPERVAKEIKRPPQKSAPKPHASDVDALARISECRLFNVHFRVSPKKAMAERLSSLADAVALAERWNVEHGKHGRRAMISAIPPDGRDAIPIKQEWLNDLLEPAADPPPEAKHDEASVPPKGADLSILAPEGAPYALRIDAAHVRQNSAHTDALEISRLIKRPVVVLDREGRAVRCIDDRAFQQWRKTLKAGSGAKRGGGGRRAPPARGDTKQSRAIALLTREGGATAAELHKVTDWPIAQRHINRLSKVSGLRIEVLGEKKWRLVPPA